MTITVIRGGLFTTVQDLGRRGLQHLGVPSSGAMDPLSLRVANLLVGNDENAAGLEITMVGPTLRVDTDAIVALCGGDFPVLCEGQRLPLGRPVALPVGSRVAIGAAKSGCRLYLAVAGGIDVPPVLGSRSTYTPAGFGGLCGRKLQAGDVLPIGPVAPSVKSTLPMFPDHVRWCESVTTSLWSEEPIRILKGREFEQLSDEGQRALFSEQFIVSNESDRMGVRLAGPTLAVSHTTELISSAVVPGTIQLPPDSRPIVLTSDCATTGGYPRIAYVASVDLARVAQWKPGDPCRFREITLAEAHALLLAQESKLQCLATNIRLRFGQSRLPNHSSTSTAT
jgi:antagonist of KipI